MAKGAEAFRSIGEVAKLIGVAPHVLRYWETQFTALKPMKRPDGRRYYRPADVDLAAGICAMLRDDGLTIRGARKLIADDRGEAVRRRGVAHLEGRMATHSDAGDQDAMFSPPVSDVASEGSPQIVPSQADAPLAQADAAPHTAPAPHPSMAPVAPLALFPETGPAPQTIVWLARLTDLAQHLRQITPADPRWSRVRPAALRLGQAMLRLV
ncbi:MerR family transcriptional regulator [Paracoccus nototheniae]|uniref:MerR family transcriptional regulator n=1 Tax=Paracoccus nototheniae TaxID=2489002 RepID=A0ABW4DW68_9RHOB|nr:MerR family transcriptional regulator [Paracoccus nototheniae]